MERERFSRNEWAAVRDYHQYHGDTGAKPIRRVKSSDGNVAVLTRVKDAHGDPVSCLLIMERDSKSETGLHVYETDATGRETEGYMIEDWINGYRRCV